jgi:PAS domain S-box-containing protein
MPPVNDIADLNQLKSYIDNAGDGIYVIDLPSGRIISCNRQACLDSGYTQDELLRLRVTDIDANFRPSEIDKIHGELTPGKPILVESVHKRKDGSTYPVEIRLNLLDSAKPQHVISIVRDITDRKVVEEKLRESEEHYRDRSMRRKDDSAGRDRS